MDELEKALAQLDAVNTSRGVLRVEYAGQKGSAPMLGTDNTTTQGGPRGRKARARSQDARGEEKVKEGMAAKRPRKGRASKANSDAASGAVADTAVTKRRARGAKKSGAPSAVKYKDPASDKTWSGRGRRPAWLRGDPDGYLVSNLESNGKGNPDAPGPANQTVS